MSKKAIIVGASGLIGSELVKILLKQPEYSEVLVLVRKKIPLTEQKLHQQIVDFERLNDYLTVINGDVLFCCLGSTKGKTPDKSEYWKIDHDYPVQLAQIAKQNGIKQYHLVSSIGADENSSSFYLKMKGSTENDIKKTGVNSLHIYEPSLLVGNRQDNRLLEKITATLMGLINPLLIGRWKKYRSIQAKQVAFAMYKQSLINQTGEFIYSSDKIQEIA